MTTFSVPYKPRHQGRLSIATPKKRAPVAA